METAYWNDYYLKRKREKLLPEAKKGKVHLKAKTCLQRVNLLIPEMRLTGSYKITNIYFQKNPVSGHFAPKFQLATQGKLEAIF